MPPTYQPKSWHLVAVALIGLLDLVVLYMLINPRVSEEYRAYYIDRTSSCFPRIISGYYPLGEPVTFVPGRSGYDRDTIRWCGFMPPKNNGITSFGDYGILKLKFDVPDDDLLLTFTSFANTTADKPAREVHVVVNGQPVGTLLYTSGRQVVGRMVIPERVAKLGDHGLEIRFEVPRTGPPGTNTEPITLQLRLEALRVSPLGNGPETRKAGFPPPPGKPGRLG